MDLIDTLPTLALCVSGAMAVIASPLAVMEVRYELRRRRIRRIETIPAPQFPETGPEIRSLKVSKITDKRRRTYSLNPYLGPVPPQIDALPAPDDVPGDQKV